MRSLGLLTALALGVAVYASESADPARAIKAEVRSAFFAPTDRWRIVEGDPIHGVLARSVRFDGQFAITLANCNHEPVSVRITGRERRLARSAQP